MAERLLHANYTQDKSLLITEVQVCDATDA